MQQVSKAQVNLSKLLHLINDGMQLIYNRDIIYQTLNGNRNVRNNSTKHYLCSADLKITKKNEESLFAVRIHLLKSIGVSNIQHTDIHRLRKSIKTEKL